MAVFLALAFVAFFFFAGFDSGSGVSITELSSIIALISPISFNTFLVIFFFFCVGASELSFSSDAAFRFGGFAAFLGFSGFLTSAGLISSLSALLISVSASEFPFSVSFSTFLSPFCPFPPFGGFFAFGGFSAFVDFSPFAAFTGFTGVSVVSGFSTFSAS